MRNWQRSRRPKTLPRWLIVHMFIFGVIFTYITLRCIVNFVFILSVNYPKNYFTNILWQDRRNKFLPDSLLVIRVSATLLFPIQRVAVTSRFPESFTMVSYLINCYYHSIVTMQPPHSACIPTMYSRIIQEQCRRWILGQINQGNMFYYLSSVSSPECSLPQNYDTQLSWWRMWW